MDGELRGMVMAYRVTELQALLTYAGKNKQGKKNELQARCLELVKLKAHHVVQKMRELYRSIQMSNFGQPLSVSGAANNIGMEVAQPQYASDYYHAYKQVQDTSFGRSIGYQRIQSMDGLYRTIPLCPDVKLRELPFFDTLAVLIRPTTLVSQSQLPKQEIQQSFYLTATQAGDIASSRELTILEGAGPRIQYNVQVQLRFCSVDTATDEEQDDNFPSNLVVKLNGRNVPLPHPIPSNRPGVEPKRPSKPLNITTNVKCSPISTNTISVQWVVDQKMYAMSVYLVKKLGADDLFERLKSKKIQPPEFTRGRIKQLTTAEEDDVCAPTSIRVSVACPLGKNRMEYPCRATTCKHLQCFDANLFFLMNEKKPTFICPVCNNRLKFGDLCVDGYFMDVIKELGEDDGNDIELYPDGRWESASKMKAEESDGPQAKKAKLDDDDKKGSTKVDDDEICIIDDDSPPQTPVAKKEPPPKVAEIIKPKVVEPEIVDLSSDEETTPPTTTAPVQDDDSTTDEIISRRPRRRAATRTNYIVDNSSDDESTNDGTSRSSRGSADTSQKQRAFASVGNHSSSRLAETTTSTGTPQLIQNPTTFTYSQTLSQSMLTTPAYYSPTSASAVPGYTAYDARTEWGADLNSLINMQQQQMGLNFPFNYLNSNSTNQQHPNLGQPPGGSGSGYPGWI